MPEIPIYPPQLPPPDDAFELDHVDPVLRTGLGNGRDREERLMGTVPTNTTLSYLFTIPEFQLFEGWFRWTIRDGVLPFLGPMKTSVGIHSDLEMKMRMYKARSNKGLWVVTAPVQILKRQTISELDAQFPEEIIRSSLFDLTINKHYPKAKL